jgi:hypothetical protein
MFHNWHIVTPSMNNFIYQYHPPTFSLNFTMRSITTISPISTCIRLFCTDIYFPHGLSHTFIPPRKLIPVIFYPINMGFHRVFNSNNEPHTSSHHISISHTYGLPYHWMFQLVLLNAPMHFHWTLISSKISCPSTVQSTFHPPTLRWIHGSSTIHQSSHMSQLPRSSLFITRAPVSMISHSTQLFFIHLIIVQSTFLFPTNN